MHYPRLIHPIAVYIRKKEVEFTAVMDDNLHEPVGQVRRPKKPVKLMCQHKSMSADELRAAFGGAIEQAGGYCLFLTADLTKARVTIESGDRIIQIGDSPNKLDVDYYINRLQHLGHYHFANGPTLLRAYYEDREPTRHRE